MAASIVAQDLKIGIQRVDLSQPHVQIGAQGMGERQDGQASMPGYFIVSVNPIGFREGQGTILWVKDRGHSDLSPSADRTLVTTLIV